jgi:uncharacterized protein YegL
MIVAPIYLLCDTSHWMQKNIHSLEREIEHLMRHIVLSPVLDDIAQISVISFSDVARTEIPLTQASEIEIPTFTTGGSANYGTVFRHLAENIVRDRARLREQAYRIQRPIALLLTAGKPDDADWHEAFIETLTYEPRTGSGFKAHPIFIPFSFGSVTDNSLDVLAYPSGRSAAHHAESSTIERVIANIVDSFASSRIAELPPLRTHGNVVGVRKNENDKS